MRTTTSSLQQTLRRAEKRVVNSGSQDPVKLSLFSPRRAEKVRRGFGIARSREALSLLSASC